MEQSAFCIMQTNDCDQVQTQQLLQSFVYGSSCQMTFKPCSQTYWIILTFNSSFSANRVFRCLCCHETAWVADRWACVSSPAKCFWLRSNFCHSQGFNQTSKQLISSDTTKFHTLADTSHSLAAQTVNHVWFDLSGLIPALPALHILTPPWIKELLINFLLPIWI